MSLKAFREKVNILLYDSKASVLGRMKWASLVVSLFSLGTLIYLYGFDHDPEGRAILLNIIKGSFAFYIVYYIIRFIYDFRPREFLKRTWFEAILMLILVVEGIAYNFFDTLLLQSVFIEIGLEGFSDFTGFFIQLYFLVIVGVELGKSSNRGIPLFRLHPALIFILSFVVIILGGTALLCLPEMTTNGISVLDALFTSTSATCVTGLMVENMTEFTYKGQVLILILVKLGGLNIIAFGAFIALASRLGVGVKHDSVIEDFINKDSVISAKGLLGRIIIWSVIIELVGAFLMYVFWLDEIPFESNGDKLFSSIFHSVSSFNNAGLSTFSDGMYDEIVRGNNSILIIMSFLIFFGALGFNAIFDVFSFKGIRDRIKNPWKQISFSSKIALYFSLIFVGAGLVLFFLLERDNTIGGDYSLWDQMVHSLFQSINRTSGFASVDMGSVGAPALILIIFLMFVGSSSSSTGGGIKTSTFAILWASTMSTIRGRKHIELYKRTISQDLVMRAFSVLIFFILGNLVCIFLLAITEADILAQSGRSVLDLIFEEVSALGTVGLSTGITPDLSPAGRIIIIVSMFVGRVGTLTVAIAFGKAVISRNYKYPSGHTLVG